MKTPALLALALAAGALSAAAVVACGSSGGNPSGGGPDAAVWGLEGGPPPPHDGSGPPPDAPPQDGFTPGFDAAGIDGGDLRFFAGTGSAGGVHASTWVHAQGAWTSPALLTVPTNGTVAWIVPALNYDRTELLAVESQFATSTGIDVLSGSGSTFIGEISISGLRKATSADHRSFDMTLEGDYNAILVYSDDTPIPRWQERIAVAPTFWSPAAPVFSTAPGTGTVEWVQLAARPNTNTVALVYSTSNEELFLSLWDGSAWGTPTQLAGPSSDGGTTPLFTESWPCFGAAYTDPSGDLFVGYSLANAGFTWVVQPSGQTTISAPTPVPGYAPPGTLSMVAEPGTSHIAISFLENDGTSPVDHVVTLVWDGTQIANPTQLDSYGLGSGYGPGASPEHVGWLTSAGAAVAVYAHGEADGGISGNLAWGEWTNPNGWVLQPEAPITPPLPALASARVASLLTGDRLFAFLESTNGPIRAASFDGTTWSDTYDGGAIEGTLSRTTGVPFAALAR